ncbi:hypothetical protein [Bacillus thuringiensis]|uniref:hypothetical protein n=1 Tax=Bacillus thuringiensis TaxID=1428 RepID=UPI000BFC3F6D|nr:hypothetical protein [Bacillus thuringiensis]PGM50828.1 hypothetical protein CN949_16185 [Bacillus thuringiensis]
MKTQLNIMEVLASNEGTKFKITATPVSRFLGEKVVVRKLSEGTALYHVLPSGREHKLAMTSATINAKFEEHRVVEFVQTDFTALVQHNPKQVFIETRHGEYEELCIYKDFTDFGIRDTDDLQRSRKFFYKKVNGEYVTKD